MPVDGVRHRILIFFGLLGLNWGYILDEDGENTFLNGVVPAWKILELLEVPALKEQKQKRIEELKRRVSAQGPSGAVQAAVFDPPIDENPKHREDFTSLVGAAARKREQED